MRPILVATVVLVLPALAVGQGRAWPDCYCTGTEGERYEMGESACLRVDGRSFLATCEMSLNVPIWRDTGEGCVTG